MTRPCRLKDIAERAGLAVSTVSHILNGNAARLKISPATERRVLDIAEAMGYQADYFASTVQSGSSNVVAIVGNVLDMRFRERRRSLVAQALKREGFHVHVFEFQWESGPKANVLEEVERLRPEGVLVSEASGPAVVSALEQMNRRGLTVVGLDVLPGADIDQVFLDRREVSYSAARYLLRLGHHDIAYTIDGHSDQQVIRDRVAGFTQAMDEAGIKATQDQFVWVEGHVSNYERGQELVSGGHIDPGRASAAMALNDQIGIGMLSGCQERGVSVPGDLSIIGAEGLDEGEYAAVPLTSVSFSLEEWCQKAVQLLLRRMGGETGEAEVTRIRPKIIERDSCCPPKPSNS